ncbi:hypothetical protein [Nocardia gipuzkoensis]|uniref:hypothetical protein n=1 Tax=Nocardia gipuzkoensis TaxID=2749991 RepID=UPI00237D99FF|nr:hypothetical protein [Nocardia gipuzkoensis]MDE1670576.1 hypothetical protein [Nocardia gipuzkoensis]
MTTSCRSAASGNPAPNPKSEETDGRHGPVAENLCWIDWNDIDDVELNCREALNELAAEPRIVRTRLEQLPDRPHNHRWSYASRILRGQYRHYLFGNAEVDEQVEPMKLPVLQAREEPVGTTYALHHTMVHAVVAEPCTVSLVIRGPAVKDKFLVMDRKSGEAWWQYGATQESAEDALRRRMTPARLQELIGRLDKWQLF